ncbi:SRPBCC family protein [Actinotalea sp. AC32]|nr:SRPBCC family protein [Actinotalea sp. AC32]
MTGPATTTPDAAARHVPQRRPAVARRVLPLAAEDAWTLLTDMRNHARWIPLTRIDAPASLPVGARFTAVSGPLAVRGAPGFPDTMEVVLAVPPHTDPHGPGTTGEVTYRKVGPVLHGTASLVVRPLGHDACEVRWEERVHLRGLPPALTAPFLRPVLAAMVAFALRRVAAEVGDPGRS